MTHRYLALDIGESRTGVAFGQQLSNTVQPIASITVKHGKPDFQALDKLINDWQPNKIVIGNIAEQAPALKKIANRFTAQLQSQHKLPVISIDETLSTHAANLLMNELAIKPSERKQKRDQFAAAAILSSYFQQRIND